MHCTGIFFKEVPLRVCARNYTVPHSVLMRRQHAYAGSGYYKRKNLDALAIICDFEEGDGTNERETAEPVHGHNYWSV